MLLPLLVKHSLEARTPSPALDPRQHMRSTPSPSRRWDHLGAGMHLHQLSCVKEMRLERRKSCILPPAREEPQGSPADSHLTLEA